MRTATSNQNKKEPRNGSQNLNRKHWDPVFLARRPYRDRTLPEIGVDLYSDGDTDEAEAEETYSETVSVSAKYNTLGVQSEDDEGERRVDCCNKTEHILLENGVPMRSADVEKKHDAEDMFEASGVPSMFLNDPADGIPSWEAKVIRTFFSPGGEEDSSACNSTAWAWIDDREYATGLRRDHKNGMSAYELCTILKQKVSGDSESLVQRLNKQAA